MTSFGFPTLSRSLVGRRTWPFFFDLLIAVAGLACFYGIIQVTHYWIGPPQPSINISLSPRALPVYAFYSIVRIFLAYILSLVFAVGYGYTAAYSPRLEGIMIAALDVLQSIPVLSFLPAVMLAMVALFPTHQIGVEMGAILLIFTGQVWNMAFSFYSSIKSIPRELREATAIYRFSAWQRFWQMELPYSAIGLIWNSMVSVAGGWFFLTACEMFTLGDRDFRLAGLGSYLQTAASQGGSINLAATIYGIVTVLAIIILTDQLAWRPLIAWSDKFKFEQVESADRTKSPVLEILQQSAFLHGIQRRTLQPMSEMLYRRMALIRKERQERKAALTPEKEQTRTVMNWVLGILLSVILGVIAIIAAGRAMMMLRSISISEVLHVLAGAGATLLRVDAALLIAALWTIPAGVAIGFHPKLARIAQPVAQIAASFPATVIFPLIIIGLTQIHMGLGIGSIALMLLGTQWYVLFNVIAGAMAIPSDLREVASLFRFGRLQRWTTVILPGIFPYLITGMVTASGGAWNASIIAEYYHLKDKTYTTLGLGAEISQASDHGQYALLLLSTVVMALMVVTINRLLWRRLYRLAETRYKLEG